MKGIRRLVLVAAGVLGVQFAMGAPAVPAEFFVKDGDRVVFLGDSITEQRLYTTYMEAYVLSRYPQWQLTFRNVGWGGDTSWLRQRFATDEEKLFAASRGEQQKMIEAAVNAGLARDVLPLKPTAVTIKFGMNDHCYQAFRKDIHATYVRSQSELADVLQKAGARLAFLTPQPIEEVRPDPDKDERNLSLRKFGDGLKKVANEKGARYVDLFDSYLAIMMKVRRKDGGTTIGGGDAIHPGPPGQTIMAWEALKGLGATSLVSSAEILVKGEFFKVAVAQQCTLSNVAIKQGVLSFERLDQALPLPIDSRALAALELAPVVADLSVYQLKVNGLVAANYDVFIDGEKAATVSREQLAAGWNMTTAQGPIARQCEELLRLIFEKNDVFFERWRNVQLNPPRHEELPALDAKIAELEGKINDTRQPKPHQFQLRPVG